MEGNDDFVFPCCSFCFNFVSEEKMCVLYDIDFSFFNPALHSCPLFVPLGENYPG